MKDSWDCARRIYARQRDVVKAWVALMAHLCRWAVCLQAVGERDAAKAASQPPIYGERRQNEHQRVDDTPHERDPG
jgi:hypothetical protein